ncbi:MAG: 50S ribosomal protein L3 N(5)-glutamine methyltransferase [Rhodoblastus sp.]|nr:MAG: 50S ribosomal protein L3 N(5)-glutamine methyltransferase [Rhodoblastus sp.]
MSATCPPEFRTLRDLFRYAITRFEEAELVFGHGTDNALDEAAFMVLEGLKLPVDRLDVFLDARLTQSEKDRLAGLVEARVSTRKPAAYLLNRTYIQGVPFYVDERAIVPRSFIGELLMTGLADPERGLVDDPDSVGNLLDLCTGGGSLAILAARVFLNARIDAVDLSADALAVAARNVEEHGLEDRVTLYLGDLFAPLPQGRRYDLILTNPPYVTQSAVDAFPPEYRAEPTMAHLGGEDGLELVAKILDQAPARLAPGGGLICEIGMGREALEALRPDLPFLWLDTATSAGEVFWLSADDFPTAPSAKARKVERRRS